MCIWRAWRTMRMAMSLPRCGCSMLPSVRTRICTRHALVHVFWLRQWRAPDVLHRVDQSRRSRQRIWTGCRWQPAKRRRWARCQMGNGAASPPLWRAAVGPRVSVACSYRCQLPLRQPQRRQLQLLQRRWATCPHSVVAVDRRQRQRPLWNVRNCIRDTRRIRNVAAILIYCVVYPTPTPCASPPPSYCTWLPFAPFGYSPWILSLLSRNCIKPNLLSLRMLSSRS